MLTDAQAELVTHNQEAARAIARRYRGRGIDVEDLAQEAMLGLIDAAPRYSPDDHPGVPFAAFARLYINRRLRKAVSVRRAVPLEVEIADPSSAVDVARERAEAFLWGSLEGLSPFERSLVIGRYGLEGPERTVDQLGRQHKLSARRIREILDRARAKLGAALVAEGWTHKPADPFVWRLATA